MLEASEFLWFPWSLALCSQLTGRELVDANTKRGCALLHGRINDLIRFAYDNAATYVMAESLFAIHLQVEVATKPRMTGPRSIS